MFLRETLSYCKPRYPQHTPKLNVQFLAKLEKNAAKYIYLLSVNNLPDKMTVRVRSQTGEQCIARGFLQLNLR